MTFENSNEPVKILLVEGLSEQSHRLREILAEGELAASVRAVRTPAEAIAFLRQQPPFTNAGRPQLILLGAGGPLSGIFEIASALERSPALRRLEVLVLSNTAPGTGGFVNTGVRDIRSVAPMELVEVIRGLRLGELATVIQHTAS